MLLSPTALRSAFTVSLTSLIETSFIELPSGFSGKRPAVVGEAWRRRIRKLCAAGERTGDIAHLETRNSISLFIRFVNHYFRFIFASAWFAPLVFPVSLLEPCFPSIPRCQLPLCGMRGILCVRGNCTFMTVGSKRVLLAASVLLAGLPALSVGQTPPPQKKLPAGPAAPQSTHYPIFILAFGNNPNWSVRIGQKVPERMDRPGYPPIPLEPAEVTHEAADSWIYHAKDSATGAAVALHLTREACTDATNDTLTTTPPLGGKYSFRASVDHAQIGSMAGCARIAAELFPKINNQPDQEEEEAKKKPPAPTITNFKAPFAVAYQNSAGSVVLGRGTAKKVVAPEGTELALSHDGKKLLYTRSDSKTSPDRTIVLYDLDSGKSVDLLHGLVRQAFWSPDDGRIVFLKALDSSWQVWSFPAGHPESALAFSPQPVNALHGWVDNHTILSAGFFLYELRSKRRANLCPPNQWGRTAEWSRDSLQVFFAGMDSSHRSGVYRIFWDGTGLQRWLTGSDYVVGQ